MTTEKEKKNKTRSEGGRGQSSGQRSVAFRVKATARGVTFSRFVFFFVVFAKLSAVSSRTNVWSVFDGESDGVVALGATAAATRSLFPGGGGEKGEDGEDGEDGEGAKTDDAPAEDAAKPPKPVFVQYTSDVGLCVTVTTERVVMQSRVDHPLASLAAGSRPASLAGRVDADADENVARVRW